MHPFKYVPLLLVSGLLACGGGSRTRLPSGSNANNNNNTPQNNCGNGVVDQGEVCDATNLGGLSCEVLGFGPGVLACAAGCGDFDRRGCAAPASCNNGVKDGSELCDGGDFGGLSCASFGFTDGSLSCFVNCGAIDTSGCSGTVAQCGDGQRAGNEVCDGADLGGSTCSSLGLGEGNLACNPDCSGFNTAGCESTCTPMCGARECGPDPMCQTSCGTCSEGTCNADGRCESANANAPRILSFATNVSEIRRGESVIFSAIVTDPDGIADVIGGTLETAAGGVYGTFATTNNEGAYSFTLSWNSMNQVIPINFTTEEQRSFLGRFYDVAGNQVTQTLMVRLHCDGAAACGGACTDLMMDSNHCGMCGRQCVNDTSCSGGMCVAVVGWSPKQGTCNQTCGSALGGLTCAPVCDFTGQGSAVAGAAQFYCDSGMCSMSQEARVYSCTEVLPESYLAADGSTMVFDYGACCCVAP